jgi:hypothetical protein
MRPFILAVDHVRLAEYVKDPPVIAGEWESLLPAHSAYACCTKVTLAS